MKLKLLGTLVFVLLGLFVGLSQPFQPELSQQGHYVLSLLCVTIGLWIFKPLGIPTSVSSALFMAAMLVLGMPPATVFSGFTGNAVWILIPALFFGYALAKTGLGRRIATLGMKTTRPTYAGVLLMWVVVGVVLSMLTPSITVRVVIITPIALVCANLCGLPEGSKGRSLILLTAWLMVLIPGTGWLTGSLNGPILSGFFAGVEGLGAISFNDWARVALLPAAIITVLTALAGYLVLKPAEPLNVSRELFRQEYARLGALSRQEIITAAILSAAFLMFVTNSLHHIPDAATCLVALFLLAAAGVIDAREISTGISWDLVIFIGSAMSFSAIFAQAGISSWLGAIVVEALRPVAGSPWLFVYSALIIMFLWRFIDIATFIPSMAVITAVLPQINAAYGISPLVWIPLITIVVNAFFLPYQNMFALVAESNQGGKGWTTRHFSTMGVVYFIVALLAMLVVIPYWISIGMFG